MNDDLVKAQTRERMRRYRERLREAGKKEIVLWVTPTQERAIRRLLDQLRERKKSDISPTEHRAKPRTTRKKRRAPP